jgi:transcription antitermination factor NusA-like protein
MTETTTSPSPASFDVEFRGSSLPVYTFTVRSIADGFLEGTLTDGRTALIPQGELPAALKAHPGSTIPVVLMADAERPVCTASHSSLVAALYAGISPEVRTGAVRIMNVSRLPGVRSKVAVAATHDGVDPVAALVGREANRVIYVSRLLGGERIDVVPFNSDLAVFAKNAMAPAIVESVEFTEGKAIVFVKPHQMPAAVGGSGLNSTLAGELIGFPIEVRSL